MNSILYMLAKKPILDIIKEEINEVVKDFSEIFEILKDLTYGNLEKLLGPDIALMFVIAVGAILLTIICLKIINR